MTETLHFHCHLLEKEMATHSSILAWRTPGTEEPVGLPSVGSHRVGHDLCDLAAAAAAPNQPSDHKDRQPIHLMTILYPDNLFHFSLLVWYSVNYQRYKKKKIFFKVGFVLDECALV